MTIFKVLISICYLKANRLLYKTTKGKKNFFVISEDNLISDDAASIAEQ